MDQIYVSIPYNPMARICFQRLGFSSEESFRVVVENVWQTATPITLTK